MVILQVFFISQIKTFSFERQYFLNNLVTIGGCKPQFNIHIGLVNSQVIQQRVIQIKLHFHSTGYMRPLPLKCNLLISAAKHCFCKLTNTTYLHDSSSTSNQVPTHIIANDESICSSFKCSTQFKTSSERLLGLLAITWHTETQPLTLPASPYSGVNQIQIFQN